MVRETFRYIPGIGAETEQALWQAGFTDWEMLLAGLDKAPIGKASPAIVQAYLETALECLASDDPSFLRDSFGMLGAWRLFPHFRDSCVFLDIETDGRRGGDAVTMVGLYDGKEFRALVRGRDLDTFLDVIAPFKMVVTFFGAGFDLPILESRYRGYKFNQIHLDLCPTLRRVGLHGGLKKIEQALGIARESSTVGLSGFDAVKLWNRYDHLGDDKALDLLIAYNREDVVNLEYLAVHAYDNLRIKALLGEDAEPSAPRSTRSRSNWSRSR